MHNVRHLKQPLVSFNIYHTTLLLLLWLLFGPSGHAVKEAYGLGPLKY